MPTLTFGNGVLQSIPKAAPGRTPLRRRTSAPELLHIDGIYGNADKPYEVGNCIRLQLQHGNRSIHTVTARIVKTFAPFSMAAVVVVRVFEPKLDLQGDFVLKAYDNRCSDGPRSDYKVETWSQKRDIELEKRRWSKSVVKFFHKIMADDERFAREDEDEDDSVFDDDSSKAIEKEEENARDEVFLQALCLKMYRAELEVYRQARQHAIDGSDVPRFIGSVRIQQRYSSNNCLTESACIKGVPGILIQYLPGFPLQALYRRDSEPLPRSHWQHVVDDGVRVIHYMTTKMSFLYLDCCPRNTLVHWDPFQQDWRCKLIDFGHCKIRKEGMSDWEWRELQAWEGEESSIGRHMQSFLKKYKNFDCVYESSQYYQDLAEDFLRDTAEEIVELENA